MHIIRPGQKVYHIPGYGIEVRESGVAAAANWWEVSGKTCVAAWQPKGAASYAASLVNLATPSTNDLTEGVAPDWATGTGWTFNGTDDYLYADGIADLVAGEDVAMSLVMRMKWTTLVNYTIPFAIARDGTILYNIFLIRLDNAATKKANFFLRDGATYKYNPGDTTLSADTMYTLGSTTTGTVGHLYINGSSDSDDFAADFGNITVDRCTIGALRYRNGIEAFVPCVIESLAFYTDTLTSGEVATVSAAMAAL